MYRELNMSNCEHTLMSCMCVVLLMFFLSSVQSVASWRHSYGSYSRWHPVTSTISGITSMRQRKHLPPLPHTQLTVNKSLKASKTVVSEGSSWYVSVLHSCDNPVDCELLRALPTIFTHILLWVLISCLILIKFLNCSCVDSQIIRCNLRKPLQCLQTAGRGWKYTDNLNMVRIRIDKPLLFCFILPCRLCYLAYHGRENIHG